MGPNGSGLPPVTTAVVAVGGGVVSASVDDDEVDRGVVLPKGEGVVLPGRELVVTSAVSPQARATSVMANVRTHTLGSINRFRPRPPRSPPKIHLPAERVGGELHGYVRVRPPRLRAL